MRQRNFQARSLACQRGITLITALIVMILVTLLALSSIEDALLEERMAGNMRNQNLAFQAAEAALREGEDHLRNLSPVPDFDGSNGYYPKMDDVLARMTGSWAVSSATISYGGGALPQLAEQPVYIIERYEAVVPSLDATAPEQVEEIYRITARGVGGNTNSEVILQSVMRHRKP